MLSKKALKELLETTKEYPGGFVVLEDNKPKFAVMDYDSYEKLSTSPKQAKAESRKIRRVLVTGGAGYIGSHTARMLIEEGYEVTNLDNLSTGRREFVQGELIEGDIGDKALLERIFTEKEYDAVIHFAASIEVGESTEKPLEYYRNNVAAPMALLDAMTAREVPYMVFSSTCAVYSNDAAVPVSEESFIAPDSPYAETKAAFERILYWLAKAGRMSGISLRYFNAAGASFDGSLGLARQEYSHLLPNVFDVCLGRKSHVDVFGGDYDTHDGTGIRDYIHVLDLARAHVLALRQLEKQDSKEYFDAFNIGTGSGYSVLEVINMVCDVTGKMVKFEIGPRRPGDREKVFADTVKATEVLGFKPEFSDLKTIVSTHWEFHRRWREESK